MDYSSKNSIKLKLADFGYSINHEDEQNKGKVIKSCGTPGYVAPEIFEGDTITSKIDIFSIGSIIFLLLTGRPLFTSEGGNKVLEMNKQCNIEDLCERMSYLSVEAQDLVLSLLERDQSQRLNA